MTRVRPLSAKDREDWARLWTEYLTFYETARGPEVYDATWTRLLSGRSSEFSGLVAVDEDDRPIGIAHYVFHRHCWSIEDVCYLQDLYVDPLRRSAGAGRALIEAVYAAADAHGCAQVYWLTQDFNAEARKLYDRIGVLTPFIKYNRR